ncbi:Actin-binding FH2 protein isoform 1 [Hibiscus syriacus]|uniref:Actin-binding FH2 protein isoform 1 n=1 Tax=Hibiscus syriacus TaxID=106335 RepID=A0A6A3CRP6_HIBSY|nr:Actin-binding FH2 protein isoform 1 [Hibiscus syriacus]
MPMRIVLKFKPLLLSPFSKSKSPPPLRIADVLLLQDHEEDRLLHADGCTGSSNCSKPRRIAARLFFCFARGKLKNKIHGDQKKGDDDVASPGHVTLGPVLSPGCCLLHLIAESKNELQKLTGLRIQMESVLQTVKEGVLNKDLLAMESNEGDGVKESLGFNSNLISNKALLDQSLKREDAPKGDLEGMDRLEAELEVELERLQLLLDSGKFPTNPPEETIEECKSCSLSHGEAMDDVEEEDRRDSHCGVPPYELQRKLHELLETRQEQQIKELEDALERAKKELREKEREISWWKDTAHLMLEHAKQPSLLNSQYVRHVQHLR